MHALGCRVCCQHAGFYFLNMSAIWKYKFKTNRSCGVANDKWAKIFLTKRDVDYRERLGIHGQSKELNSLMF